VRLLQELEVWLDEINRVRPPTRAIHHTTRILCSRHFLCSPSKLILLSFNSRSAAFLTVVFASCLLNMASTASGTFAFTKFKKLPLEIRNIVRLKYSHADLWPMCLPIWSCHHEKRSQGHWFRSFDLPKLGMLTWRSSDVAIYPPAPCHGTRMNFRGE